MPSPAIPTSSRRAARRAAASQIPQIICQVSGTARRARSRSSASPTIPQRQPSCEFPPRPRRPARRATAPRRRRYLGGNQIAGPIPRALCYVENCYAKSGNPDLVAPCGTTGCCDLEDGAAWDDAACLTVEELLARAERAEARAELAEKEPDSCRCDGKGGSIAIIIPVVIAAVLLVAAVLYLVRKRRVAARQPHRQSSMPTIGGDDEAEVEA